MSKKVIKKEGHRFGYIFGGIISLLVGALFFMLYFPSALNVLFNIEPIWDLSGAFAGVFGEGFVKYLLDLGVLVVLAITACTYLVCLVARRSANAQILRLSAFCNVLALTLAALPGALIAISADLTATALNLTTYFYYAILALWAISLILFIAGIVLRAKQKYHVNRATTTLSFAATFWLILTAFYALNTITALAKLGVNSPIVNICATVFTITPALLSLFYIAVAIWQFCTVPHRVVLPNDKFVSAMQNKGDKKPIMVNQNGAGKRYTYDEMANQRKLENEQNARTNLKYTEENYIAPTDVAQQNPNYNATAPNEVPYPYPYGQNQFAQPAQNPQNFNPQNNYPPINRPNPQPIQNPQLNPQPIQNPQPAQNIPQPVQNPQPNIQPMQNPQSIPNPQPAPYGNYQTPPNYGPRPVNSPAQPAPGRTPIAPQPRPVQQPAPVPQRPTTLPPRPVQPLPPKTQPNNNPFDPNNNNNNNR